MFVYLHLQGEEYFSNRPLSHIGERIFRGEHSEILTKRTMGVEEAEYLRAVELGGIGRRPYTNIRLRLLPFGVSMPNFHKLIEFEKDALYERIPFFNGWRAQLPKILEVHAKIGKSLGI